MKSFKPTGDSKVKTLEFLSKAEIRENYRVSFQKIAESSFMAKIYPTYYMEISQKM